MRNRFNVGKHVFSAGMKPIFLPDIGTFFNQDVTQAKKIIKQLSDLGVSIVKGEILHSPDVCLKKSGVEKFYGNLSKEMHTESYRSLIERKVLTLIQYEEIFRYCQSLNMEFIVSVYDIDGANFAKEIGAVAIKISSSCITHQPLIEHLCSFGLPLIIDTGHSTLEEIARAVSWCNDCGNYDFIIEHSPLPPPHSVNDHNLNFMLTIGKAFDVYYGLSDHHASDEMMYAAVAMGASLIEVGVCHDDLANEQDAGHALPISSVVYVMNKLDNIYRAMGNGVRHLRRDREKYISRMCLVAKRELHSGDCINLENITFAFPSKGIGTEHWSAVCNSSIKHNIPAGTPIQWTDINAIAL
jgi:sialic acid synthase SpsE